MSDAKLLQDLAVVVLFAAAAGWLCQRVGVPRIAGYLSAGILLSPDVLGIRLMSDPGRVAPLAEVGLVFLMFSLGLGLSLQRLRRIGLTTALGAVLIATMMLGLCRVAGVALGWPAEQALVLGALLMASSTMVIGQGLAGANEAHSRFGRTSMMVSAVDDLIAVTALTVFGSMILVEEWGSASMLGGLLRVMAAIIAIMAVALLLAPMLTRWLRKGLASEVRLLAVPGVLMAMALFSAWSGFSAALGAFLFGSIVSSTGRSARVGGPTSLLSEAFAPLFFVGMGARFDPGAVAGAWPLIAGVLVLAVAGRAAVATVSLLMTGESLANAVRAGLGLTAVGEFTLVMSMIAVAGGLAPASYVTAAVVVCLASSLICPVLIRNSETIARVTERLAPRRMSEWAQLYGEWIAELRRRRNSSLLWRLTAPQLFQAVMLVLLVSGLLVFAQPLRELVDKWMGGGGRGGVFEWAYWFVFLALLLAPLIALWRHVEVLSMVCAEAAVREGENRARLRPLFEMLMRGVATVGIVLWLAVLVPYEAFPGWSAASLAAACLAVGVLGWRRLVRVHSRFEIELRRHLAESPFEAGPVDASGSCHGDWGLNVAEFVIREGTRPVLRRISELPLREAFGCTVVRLQRQGVWIVNPAPGTALFPDDRLVVVGREEDLSRAGEWLNGDAEEGESWSNGHAADVSLECVAVPKHSTRVGKALGELTVSSRFGVQVVGIGRGDRRIVGPSRSERIQGGDRLLVLGTTEQVSEMAFWLAN